jgi:leucyl-tRNA synthetase
MTTSTPAAAPDRYDPAVIEPKWQARWAADRLYETPDADAREPYYLLTMFPYTSGDLHIGHWFAIAPPDVAARYQRMRGNNVLFPIGFDAFGLPAENAAIRDGTHPHTWTYQNVDRMRAQLRTMGASFDWSREIITSDPEYYRWTQWLFLQLLENDLAYRAMAPANWCPSCQTVLANEQVLRGDDAVGHCERCDAIVEMRDLEQWFFRITQYAEELLDFSAIEWPERIRAMQTHWIGRSEGAEIRFPLETPVEAGDAITVFTTRADTVFGTTSMALAPEHPLVAQITTDAQRAAVEDYVRRTRLATEIERQSTERPKTGVATGAYALHPFTGARIPIWIADYVLLGYGHGAVMGVPAHDERDFAFARQYGLEIPVVIAGPDWDGAPLSEAHTGDGALVNSGEFDGLSFQLQAFPGLEDYLATLYGGLERSGLNQSRVDDPAISAAVDEINGTFDVDERNEKVRNIQRDLLIDPMWYVPSVAWQLDWVGLGERAGIPDAWHGNGRGGHQVFGFPWWWLNDT